MSCISSSLTSICHILHSASTHSTIDYLLRTLTTLFFPFSRLIISILRLYYDIQWACMMSLVSCLQTRWMRTRLQWWEHWRDGMNPRVEGRHADSSFLSYSISCFSSLCSLGESGAWPTLAPALPIWNSLYGVSQVHWWIGDTPKAQTTKILLPSSSGRIYSTKYTRNLSQCIQWQDAVYGCSIA